MKTESIQKHLQITPRKAAIALSIIRGKLDPLKYPKHFPATDSWANSCYNPLPKSDAKLSALNELFEMHGVEPIRVEGRFDRYYGDVVACYLNTGDTYAPTILLDYQHNRWLLTSWGDFVEQMETEQVETE